MLDIEDFTAYTIMTDMSWHLHGHCIASLGIARNGKLADSSLGIWKAISLFRIPNRHKI